MILDELRERSSAGDAEAQFQLAQILQYGLGTMMDEEGALELYHQSALQGYERAQFVLGEIYMEGRITPQNIVKAFQWFVHVENREGPLSEAAANSRQYLSDFISEKQRLEAIALVFDE